MQICCGIFEPHLKCSFSELHHTFSPAEEVIKAGYQGWLQWTPIQPKIARPWSQQVSQGSKHAKEESAVEAPGCGGEE